METAKHLRILCVAVLHGGIYHQESMEALRGWHTTHPFCRPSVGGMQPWSQPSSFLPSPSSETVHWRIQAWRIAPPHWPKVGLVMAARRSQWATLGYHLNPQLWTLFCMKMDKKVSA